MSTLIFEASANRVWFGSENIGIGLTDERQMAISFAYFPRLQNAALEQRAKYEMSGGGTGLHWEEIDEDMSVHGLLLGNRDLTYYKSQI